jgi:hypothetical protein
MPNSTIESAESLCLAVQSDQLLFNDKSRPRKESESGQVDVGDHYVK